MTTTPNSTGTARIFSFSGPGIESPADLVGNAADLVRFLHHGLSERHIDLEKEAAVGFLSLLGGLEATLRSAFELLRDQGKGHLEGYRKGESHGKRRSLMDGVAMGLRGAGVAEERVRADMALHPSVGLSVDELAEQPEGFVIGYLKGIRNARGANTRIGYELGLRTGGCTEEEAKARATELAAEADGSETDNPAP